MVLLDTNQTLYVVLAILGCLLVVILITLLIFINKYQKTHIKELTYLKLRKICEVNDYLLLNNYKINIDDNTKANIDHIVICNKFILIISDFPISGVLSGKPEDEELVNYNKKPVNIVNPLNYNFNVAKRLALFNDLSLDMIKGIVVINNDSEIKMDFKHEQFRIIKLKELDKQIQKIDSICVKNLKEESVVRFINYLNETNK